jgi:hypothetical protein
MELNAAATLQRLLEWHGYSDADLHLRCGELTAQEIRSIRAVLNAIVGFPPNKELPTPKRAKGVRVKPASR